MKSEINNLYENGQKQVDLLEISEIKELSRFKLLIEKIKTPSGIDSQMIFSEFFAHKDLTYWLDSSKVFNI